MTILNKLNAQRPINSLENKIKTDLAEKSISIEELGIMISRIPKKTKVYHGKDVWEYLRDLEKKGEISLVGIESFEDIIAQRLYSSGI